MVIWTEEPRKTRRAGGTAPSGRDLFWFTFWGSIWVWVLVGFWALGRL